MARPVQISQAVVAFNPNQIRLNQLNMKTGKSDIQAALERLIISTDLCSKTRLLKANFNIKFQSVSGVGFHGAKYNDN